MKALTLTKGAKDELGIADENLVVNMFETGEPNKTVNEKP